MKKILFLLSPLLFLACIQLPNTGSSNNSGQRISAKVIRITCASTVIQVLDSAYYNLGETWTMQGTSNTYEHVAVVSNKCDLPETLKEGDTFFFKVIPQQEASKNCVVCMMYDFPPSKGIYLKVVN